jgi:hypothetical protein
MREAEKSSSGAAVVGWGGRRGSKTQLLHSFIPSATTFAPWNSTTINIKKMLPCWPYDTTIFWVTREYSETITGMMAAVVVCIYQDE